MFRFTKLVAVTTGMAAAVILAGWLSAQPRAAKEDGWARIQWRLEADQPLKLETAERPRTEAEVPARALQTLRDAAGENDLVAFEEEIRNGRHYYEGEWKTPRGQEEATVTADGVLVGTESDLPSSQVPTGVREAAEKLSSSAQAKYARRSFIYYEVEYVQGGREREMLLSPTGEIIGTELSGERASTASDVD